MASTENLPIYIDAVEVTSTSTSSVGILWNINPETQSNVLGYRVHYQKIASSYIQYGPHLSPTVFSYTIDNLVADTYYRICLMMLRNDTTSTQKCVDASTRSWHIPVSIGSSIGAILALSMIVLVILLLRWPSSVQWKRRQRSQNYNSMSSHFNDDYNDFSESVTMTAGHDEMFSDQSEGYILEIPLHCYHDKPCNGNTNYVLHAVHPRKESVSSIHKHSGTYHLHCQHAIHSPACPLANGAVPGDHHADDLHQDLNHNHHHQCNRHSHDDSVILHANSEEDEEEADEQILPHANTEPILHTQEFFYFEMQDMQEVSNMPEPEVKRKYLETSIDDDFV